MFNSYTLSQQIPSLKKCLKIYILISRHLQQVESCQTSLSPLLSKVFSSK